MNCYCEENKDEESVLCVECMYSFHLSCVGIKKLHTKYIRNFVCAFCEPFSRTVFVANDDSVVQALVRQYSIEQLRKKIDAAEAELTNTQNKIDLYEKAIETGDNRLRLVQSVENTLLRCDEELLDKAISLKHLENFMRVRASEKLFASFVGETITDVDVAALMKARLDMLIKDLAKKKKN